MLSPYFNDAEKASGGNIRITFNIKPRYKQRECAKIIKYLKDLKIKIQISIQGDQLKVAGKKRDDLQDTMAHFKVIRNFNTFKFYKF